MQHEWFGPSVHATRGQKTANASNEATNLLLSNNLGSFSQIRRGLSKSTWSIRAWSMEERRSQASSWWGLSWSLAIQGAADEIFELCQRIYRNRGCGLYFGGLSLLGWWVKLMGFKKDGFVFLRWERFDILAFELGGRGVGSFLGYGRWVDPWILSCFFSRYMGGDERERRWVMWMFICLGVEFSDLELSELVKWLCISPSFWGRSANSFLVVEIFLKPCVWVEALDGWLVCSLQIGLRFKIKLGRTQ